MPLRRPARSRLSTGRSARSLTAAAENLADRLNQTVGTTIGESWQSEALELYDEVPEFRQAARLAGQALSQCRLVLARVDEKGVPVPLADDEDHPAKALLAQFAGGAGGQSAMLDAFGAFMTVTGETILVGNLDPKQGWADDFQRMQPYSTSQIVARAKQITVKRDDTATLDKVLDREAGEVAVRIWRPHLRFNWKADAPGKAAMNALREIRLYDQHIEASAISRLVSAGLLLVPEGLTLPGLPAEDDNDQTDPFVRFLIHVMSLAIQNRQSAAARVPIMIRGETEDLEGLKHVSLATPFDEKVSELRKDAIGRLAVAVDMPADLLLGLGSTQSWTGAQITQDWVNNYVPALMSLFCGSATSGWLYPAMAADPAAASQPADVIIWFDASDIRTRENTGPEAFNAWDRGVINDDALRRAIGYDDGDAPEDTDAIRQYLRVLLFKAPALAPLILAALGFQMDASQQEQAKALAALLGPGGAGAGSPEQGGPTSEGPGLPTSEPTTTAPPGSTAMSVDWDALVRK